MSLIRPKPPETAEDDADASGTAPGLPFGSTVYQRVHEHLRAEIVAGRIPPGTRLKIQDLASRLGLSHMPVREALQQLQGEGLVVLQPNRGATVRRMDQRFVRNIFAIREALEGHLTRQAAGLLGPGGIARLRGIQGQMRRAQASGDIGGVVRLNRHFHRTIETATGNDEAIRVLDLHSDLIGALRIRFGYRRGRLATVLREHDALIAALARGDAAEAGALHDRHIQAARDDMLAAMDDDMPG